MNCLYVLPNLYLHLCTCLCSLTNICTCMCSQTCIRSHMCIGVCISPRVHVYLKQHILHHKTKSPAIWDLSLDLTTEHEASYSILHIVHIECLNLLVVCLDSGLTWLKNKHTAVFPNILTIDLLNSQEWLWIGSFSCFIKRLNFTFVPII